MIKGVLIFFALACVNPVFPALFGGNWSNSLLLHDDKIDTSRPFIGYYENVDLFAKKLMGSDLSAFSNVSYTKDYALPGLKRLEINNLYLDWTGICKVMDIRAGRQRDYEGNTPVYFDGINLKGRFFERFVIQAGGGLKVPSRFSDRILIRDRDSVGVAAIGRLDYRMEKGQAGLIYQHGQEDSTITRQDLDAYISRQISDNIDGRLDILFDALQNDIRSFEAAVSYRPSDRLALDGSFSKEGIRVDSSSVFETKVYQPYYEGLIDASYSLSDDVIITGEYVLRRFAGDSLAHALSAGLSMARARLNVREELGYGGALTQADAAAKVWRNESARAWIKTGMLRYGASGDYAFMGGVDLTAGPASSFWNVNLDAQILRNRSYQYDFRAYLGTNLYFTKFIK